MNLNLPGSRRWRLHDHTRVHASRERYQSTQVYVELHDDIGLPHTLYNVLVGVFPSILRGASMAYDLCAVAATRSPRWRDKSPRWRRRAHAIAATQYQ